MRKAPSIDRTYGHIDTGTGDDAPHVRRRFSLFTCFDERRQEWPFEIAIPRDVSARLTETDFEFVCRALDTRTDPHGLSPIEATILVARVAGKSFSQVCAKVEEIVKTNLWRVFGQKQLAAGNKAWLVPRALVRTGDPNG